MVIVDKLVHNRNAYGPMRVTEFGMVMLERLELSNAYWPIVVTEVGTMMVDKLLHPAKELAPM